ncbi:MAG: ABC transporter substrate-binding protein, partial [Candidatus Bathyarchaeota archaeon]|nr:ABC transporter substrate-binding protein [Candidatus Bathyarchaeota archaeon]
MATSDVTAQDHMIVATIGEPGSVDPAWVYDTASAELVQNVYDTLVFFAVDRSLPRAEQGRTDTFVPAIATDWTITEISDTDPETGLEWVQRYTFTIRENVPWHDPTYGTVTTADVEYSMERWMVQDRSGGPTWMILEPTMGLYSTRGKTGAEAIKFGKMIDH